MWSKRGVGRFRRGVLVSGGFSTRQSIYKLIIMVYAKTWEDFEIAAEAMLMENPEKCRYSMKYAHNKQTLVLKVTNNAKVSSTSF